MTTTTANPYMLARKAAGMTQVSASMRLHIDVRTLQKYEKERTPPSEIRAAMAKLYNAPQLCVDQRSPGAATNLFMKELDDVIELRRKLQAITYDDRISPDERPEFERICGEIRELATACSVLTSAG